MKMSHTSHMLSVIIGLLAIVQLVSAWTVGEGGSLGQFTQGELYINAIVFMMIAIWLAHGTAIHGKKGQ